MDFHSLGQGYSNKIFKLKIFVVVKEDMAKKMLLNVFNVTFK